MQKTTNYQLLKPDPTDNYNVANDNANMDAIDAQMKANADAAAAAQQTANNATAAGAATDTVIGSRTADPTQGPAGLTGTLTQWLSWLVNRIKAITGTANWYDAPPTTLTAANNHINNTANPHNVTAAQVGAVPMTDQAYQNAKNGAYVVAGAGIKATPGTNQETIAVTPATAAALGGVKIGNGITVQADGSISVTPYVLPSDVAKLDVAQTWTATQTFSSAPAFTAPQGTAPFSITSTAVVPNLNASMANGYSFNQSLQTTDSPTFASSSFTSAVKKVSNVASQGSYGVSTIVRNILDVQLTANTATNVLVYSSPLAGNYELKGYLRATVACNVTISISYTDNGGSVSQTLYTNQALNAGDRFSILPFFFNATSSGTITVTVTASVANALYVSAALEGK